MSRENETELVCEALVREIGRAKRWQAVVGAWHALLNVRRMSKAMAEEHELLSETTTEEN